MTRYSIFSTNYYSQYHLAVVWSVHVYKYMNGIKFIHLHNKPVPKLQNRARPGTHKRCGMGRQSPVRSHYQWTCSKHKQQQLYWAALYSPVIICTDDKHQYKTRLLKCHSCSVCICLSKMLQRTSRTCCFGFFLHSLLSLPVKMSAAHNVPV